MSVDSDSKAWRECSPYLELKGHPLAAHMDRRMDWLVQKALSEPVSESQEYVSRMKELKSLMEHVAGSAAKAARARERLSGEEGVAFSEDMPVD